MVVGQDVAFGADDDTAAQTHLRAIVFAVPIKKTKPWVIGQGVRSSRLRSGDADHRRRRAFRGRTHAAWHDGAGCIRGRLQQSHALQRGTAI